MAHIKLWESFEEKLFREITQSEYVKSIDGRKGDYVWSRTNVSTRWVSVNHRPTPVVQFDPYPKSLLPALLRRGHQKPYPMAYRLDYPCNTVPISNRAVSAYLGLFPELRDLIAVVSREDSPNDRYVVFTEPTSVWPVRLEGDVDRLVDLITKGPVDTHQIAVCDRSIGGYKLTFMDDDWVMLEANHEFTSNGHDFIKCDGFAGVVQAIKYVQRRGGTRCR